MTERKADSTEEGGHVRSAAATCRAGTDFTHRGNEGFRRTVTETRSYKKTQESLAMHSSSLQIKVQPCWQFKMAVCDPEWSLLAFLTSRTPR